MASPEARADGPLGLRQLQEHPPRVSEEGLAGRQEFHPEPRSSEQRQTQLFFQTLDLPGERRLAHVETGRRSGQLALLGDGDEVFDLREAHWGGA